jgi:hypothetical protein
METRPPVLIDWVVRALIPPRARESVIGDLWERYRSPVQYLGDALRVLPFVVASQIRRSSPAPLLLLRAAVLFSLLGGRSDLSDAVPIDAPRWARAAIPALAAWLALLLRDAYRPAASRPFRDAVVDVLAAAASIALSQAAIAGLTLVTDLSPDWILSRRWALNFALVGVPVFFFLRYGGGQNFGLTPLQREMSAAELAEDYRQFERFTRRVLRLGIVPMVVAAATFAVLLVNAPSFVVKTGAALSLMGLLFISRYMRTKAPVRPLSPDADFAATVLHYRMELEHQVRLARTAPWWGFMPVLPGVLLVMLGRALASGRIAPAVVSLAITLVTLALAAWFSRHAARKTEEKMNALAAVRERQ